MRVDGYVRVSQVRGREGESFISPDEQKERIAGWAKARGHELVTVHIDLDQPGTRADRPGLMKAMARMKRGTVEALVVNRLDRFGRSAVDNARLLDEIRSHGCALMTVAEGIDTSAGPMGEFLANIFTAFAQLEIRRISEGWETARSRAVDRGVHIASKVPTGYSPGADGVLSPNADAAAVAEVIRAKARGASWGELGRMLEEAGVVTSYGGVRWTSNSVKTVISNRVYLGEARSGRFVHPAAHEPLIDVETWEAAQRVKGERPPTGEGALLSGLLRCAGCRFILKADTMTDRSGQKLRLYRCRGVRAAGKCPDPATTLGRVIEPFVEEAFFTGLQDVLAEAVTATGQIHDLEGILERAEYELVGYRDSAAVEILGAEGFDAGLRVRAGKVESAKRRLEEAREAAPAAELPDGPTLRGLWPDLSVAERRHLLRLGMDAVFLRTGRTPIAERAAICWRGEAPDDLPGMGRRVLEIRGYWPS